MDSQGKLIPVAGAQAGENDTDGFRRLEVADPLQPGYYWRVTKEVEVVEEQWSSRKVVLEPDRVLLLLDVSDFEGAAHTVQILEHPERGGQDTYRILVADFLNHFEPAPDGEAVRQREMAGIMAEVQEMQSDLAKAQANPLALPGVQEAAQEAVEKFEREAVVQAQREEMAQKERSQDINRVLRRAARRSQAAGNPLTVRRTTISDNVEMMLAGGIDSEGLKELTLEARRRTAIAEAASNWLTTRAKEIAGKVAEMTPFYAEQGRVALARASKTMKHVKQLTEGLTSLKLYTGDGVDVMTVMEGPEASTAVPLTLVQGKKFVDEEFAVWADVSDSFDWRSEPLFMKALAENESLLNQVFPTERCVVAMATTARTVDYGRLNPYEAAMNNIKNKAVFLMVRNGRNVHAVYSSEPSHEMLPRLFPSHEQVAEIVRKFDGSRIGLQDVAFHKAQKEHEQMRVAYLRLLVLLCGLDHRLKLFGEFYPPQEGMFFMRKDFQDRYFNFLRDDEHGLQLEEANVPHVREWLAACNKAVQSGSRIVLLSDALSSRSPLLKRIYGLEVNRDALPLTLIVQREGTRHYVNVPVYQRHSHGADHYRSANVYLDGDDAREQDRDWFLCIDNVRPEQLQRYIHSRRSRAADISWLRAFKRAAAVIGADLQGEQELRAHLRKTALEHRVLDGADVDEAIWRAVSTWRATHRGAAAPRVEDTKEVNALLSLMFPADRLVQGAAEQMVPVISELGAEPLALARTGRNRLVLYLAPTAEDRAPYAEGVPFGWVKRVSVDSARGKFRAGTQRFVWLEKDKPDAGEELLHAWPGLPHWQHPKPAPCRIDDLSAFKLRMSDALWLRPMLEAGAARSQCGALDLETYEGWRRMASAATDRRPQLARVAIPVAVGIRPAHGSHEEQASFVYACMMFNAFVWRYGSPDLYKKWLSNWTQVDTQRHLRQYAPQGSWHLMRTDRPLSDLVVSERGLGSFRDQIETHTRGKGGSTYAELSLDRMFDSLRGIDPVRRRAFYRDRLERANRSMGWDDADVRAAKRKAVFKEEFQPKYAPPFALSPLVWDEQRGRSVANSLLSVSTARDAWQQRQAQAAKVVQLHTDQGSDRAGADEEAEDAPGARPSC